MLFTYSVLGWFCRGTLTGFLGGLLIGVILAWFEDVQRKWKFPTAIHWFLSIICSVFAWSLFCSDTLTEAVEIIEGIQNGYSGNAGRTCGGEQAVYEAAELTAF